MMVPRRRFRRISWLDHFVRRFQDRWETNPQYRAMVSGVVGLALILTLCTCTGLMTVVSNNALASLGLTNGSNGSRFNSNTGTGNVDRGLKLPDRRPLERSHSAELRRWAARSPVPQTPVPQATVTASTEGIRPTPTPTGGGTNTAQFICTGTGNGITWTFSPCPLVHGQGGSLTISAPAYRNTGTNIIVSFGACPKGDCTIDDPPSQGVPDERQWHRSHLLYRGRGRAGRRSSSDRRDQSLGWSNRRNQHGRQRYMNSCRPC